MRFSSFWPHCQPQSPGKTDRTIASAWRASIRSTRHGVALLMVLMVLLLMSALVLTFFSGVKSEVAATAAYAGSGEAQALSETAVNLAIGQIRDATQHQGGTVSWASQPGMIRTFVSGGASGTSFKLYSSGTMRYPGNFNLYDPRDHNNQTPIDVIGTWASAPMDYVDLNAPVLSGSTYVYPILDPVDLIQATGTVKSATVDGFSVCSGAYGKALFNTVPTPATASGIVTYINMPVRWLYVTKSGSMGTLSSGKLWDDNGKQIAISANTNPIIGRVAFWTDDETCKLNINTASHGVFHGIPYANTGASGGAPAPFTERHFGYYIPMAGEYSRYPGHPATVSLSPALKGALGDPGTAGTNWALATNYYQLSPKISGSNGSQGGTVNTSMLGVNSAKLPTPGTARLYATPDELAFSTGTDANGNRLSYTGTNAVVMDPDFVGKRRFFLTTSSRAPEETLFGTPRVTLWPLTSGSVANGRNTKDRMIAYCSMIGGTNSSNSYFFQRGSVAKSDLVSVLNSTSLNFSLTGLSTSNIPDCFDATSYLAHGTRNETLWKYLQTLTNAKVPGYAGNFNSKYGSATNRDQLLTQMVDFVRSNVNLESSTNGVDCVYRYVADGGTDGQYLKNVVVPLNPDSSSAAYGTRGMGCFSSLTGITATFFIESGTAQFVVKSNWTGMITGGTNEIPAVTTGSYSGYKMRMMLTFDSVNPMAQVNGVNWPAHISVTGLNACQINGISVYPAVVDTYMYNANLTTCGVMNIAEQYAGVGLNSKNTSVTWSGSTTAAIYDPTGVNRLARCTVASDLVDVTANFGTFDFTGGTITVNVSACLNPTDKTLDRPVQTLKIKIPSITACAVPRAVISIPAPTTGDATGGLCYWVNTSINNSSHTSGTYNGHFYGLADRLAYVGTNLFNLFSGGSISSGVIPGLGIQMYESDSYSVVGGAAVINYKYVGSPVTSNYTYVSGTSAISTAPYKALIHPRFDVVRTFAVDKNTVKDYRVLASGSFFDTNLMNSLGTPEFTYPSTTTNFANVCAILDVSSGYGTSISTHCSGTTAVPYPRLVPNGANSPQLLPFNSGTAGVTFNASTLAGDWDTGCGDQPDNLLSARIDHGTTDAKYGGYFPSSNGITSNNLNNLASSPNREISSAVVFGGLLTHSGTNTNQWESLLFCPNPACYTAGVTCNHPGAIDPPDYLWLDLFTMPVVEPYAISLPLSTAGKVNMNYQIAPFIYINRSTALRGALESTWITAIGNGEGTASRYKANNATTYYYRYGIQPDYTLQGFDTLFKSGGIFKSAAQICSMFLVPRELGSSNSNTVSGVPTAGDTNTMVKWWQDYTLTADNAREDPYAHLYPLLTTQSNSYTVHVRSQALKVPSTANYAALTANDLNVTSEYRGSSLIERYVDPSDPLLTTYDATASTSGSMSTLDSFYRFRVVNSTEFAP